MKSIIFFDNLIWSMSKTGGDGSSEIDRAQKLLIDVLT